MIIRWAHPSRTSPWGSSESPSLSVLLFQWMCWQQGSRSPGTSGQQGSPAQQKLFSLASCSVLSTAGALEMLHGAGRAPLPEPFLLPPAAQGAGGVVHKHSCLSWSLWHAPSPQQHPAQPEHRHSSSSGCSSQQQPQREPRSDSFPVSCSGLCLKKQRSTGRVSGWSIQTFWGFFPPQDYFSFKCNWKIDSLDPHII